MAPATFTRPRRPKPRELTKAQRETFERRAQKLLERELYKLAPRADDLWIGDMKDSPFYDYEVTMNGEVTDGEVRYHVIVLAVREEG